MEKENLPDVRIISVLHLPFVMKQWNSLMLQSPVFC